MKQVIIIAGPNGAGKTTFAREFLPRVATRVEQGGHHIPEETVRRRFKAGLQNFENVYRAEVSYWQRYDNRSTSPILLEDGP